MRPRGESISSPHNTYVGQVGRQKPQCTQSPTSAASGGRWSSNAGTPASEAGTPRSIPSMANSDPSDETARREPVRRVELVLEAAHQLEAGHRSPQVDRVAGG